MSKMKSQIAAIDPGANGGVAWIDADGIARCAPLFKTDGQIIDQFRILRVAGIDKIAMEKVVSFIPDASQSAMFNYGGGYRFIMGVVMTMGFQLVMVQPKTWQKGLSLGNSERIKVPAPPRNTPDAQAEQWRKAHAVEIKAAKAHNQKAKTEWKRKLYEEAQRRFPHLDITLATSDALLILAYARTQPEFI